MGLSRRQFTREFKLAAVRRLEQGISIAEASRPLIQDPAHDREALGDSGEVYHLPKISQNISICKWYCIITNPYSARLRVAASSPTAMCRTGH
jgi:hypothetical protein